MFTGAGLWDLRLRTSVLKDLRSKRLSLGFYTQRAQYPLIKEYSLNHNLKPYII